MFHIIDSQNSIFNRFLAELRNKEFHHDRLRFRRNLERVGEIMAYEISKSFTYISKTIQTPINPAIVELPSTKIVIASILRAGLPFHQGFLNYMDDAESAFISARRNYDKEHHFTIRYDSIYTPELGGKQLLLVDPMLATGASLITACQELIKQGGEPLHIHIASVIASKQGLEYVENTLKGKRISLWIGSVDERLTETAYIDPGMGDAGDLAFGEKL